jgi:hypothetical protein
MAIDAAFVADHYAEYWTGEYAENHIMDTVPNGWERHKKKEYDEIIGNDAALVSYLRENLSWNQVKDHAYKIADAPKMTDDDYDDGLIFGAMSTIELEE